MTGAVQKKFYLHPTSFKFKCVWRATDSVIIKGVKDGNVGLCSWRCYRIRNLFKYLSEPFKYFASKARKIELGTAREICERTLRQQTGVRASTVLLGSRGQEACLPPG